MKVVNHYVCVKIVAKYNIRKDWMCVHAHVVLTNGVVV